MSRLLTSALTPPASRPQAPSLAQKRHALLLTGCALSAVLLATVPARADNVIADDLIVQGSACVGTDCADGEFFGFATIRMKENNTRIQFTDTSVGAFPTNDWTLEANTNVSGGRNYFAILDEDGGNRPVLQLCSIGDAACSRAIMIGAGAIVNGASGVAVGASSKAEYPFDAAFGALAQATGGSSTAIGNSASASGSQSTAVGTFTAASGINASALGGGGDGVTTFGARAIGANSTAVGFNSMASATSSIAAGHSSTAANGFDAAFGAFATASGGNSSAFGSNASAQGASSVAIGENARATQTASIAIGLNSQSTGVNAIAIGAGAVATGSIAVGAGAQAGSGGAAFGDGAVATQTNSVALGAGSVASAPNTVSVGSAGNERRITNVAPGVAATDAATVGQLSSIASGVQSQIVGLQSQIDQNRREANRGIAAAMASGTFMTPSAPGKTTFTMTSSVWNGEGALAVNLAHRLNFDRPVVLFGSYANGGGSEHGGKVGLGVEF